MSKTVSEEIDSLSDLLHKSSKEEIKSILTTYSKLLWHVAQNDSLNIKASDCMNEIISD